MYWCILDAVQRFVVSASLGPSGNREGRTKQTLGVIGIVLRLTGLGLGRQRFVRSVEAIGVVVRQLARAAISRTAWL